MKRNEMRIRVRVCRRQRVPDAHGGLSQNWHEEEERWGILKREDRFFASSHKVEGIEAGTLPQKQIMYSLKMRQDPQRAPFERFLWKNSVYAILSQEIGLSRSGYDFFWVSRVQEGN